MPNRKYLIYFEFVDTQFRHEILSIKSFNAIS